MDNSFESIQTAAAGLRSILPAGFQPSVGIICGSGLSGIADAVEPITDGMRDEVSYGEIKGFPVSAVPGHAGKLVFGHIGTQKTPIVLMNGRAHYYEGHDLQATTFPIRVMSLLGVKILIVTNAVGGLNPSYKAGDVVVIQDHINFPGLAGANPLRGPNLSQFGDRFIPLSDAYDLDLRRVAHRAWRTVSTEDSKMALHEGTYAFVAGPNYETRAECRMLSILGADTVGMSVVPEVIVARHCGIRVLAMSLVTNMAAIDAMPRGDDPELADSSGQELASVMSKNKANHQEVLEESRLASDRIKQLIVSIIDAERSR